MQNARMMRPAMAPCRWMNRKPSVMLFRMETPVREGREIDTQQHEEK